MPQKQWHCELLSQVAWNLLLILINIRMFFSFMCTYVKKKYIKIHTNYSAQLYHVAVHNASSQYVGHYIGKWDETFIFPAGKLSHSLK